MKVSLLLPTLGGREKELIRLFNSLEVQTNKNFELIVISQGNHEFIEKELEKYNFEYKQVKIETRGLSHARNVGMKYVKGDYLVLADDDAWYPHNAIQDIIISFKQCNEEVICFQIYDPIIEKYYKDYSKHKENVGNLQGLKKSSIEICININKINNEIIRFDETFGLGTDNPSGEENLLLKRIYKNGYKIKYIKHVIVYHQKKQIVSIDDKFIKTKARLFKKLFGNMCGATLINGLLIKNLRKIEGNKLVALKIANKEIFKK